MRIIVVVLILIIAHSIFAQQDSTSKANPDVRFSGFMDVFYAYDFNKPLSEKRLPFLYNHNRHNAFHVNLAIARMDIIHPGYKATLAFHSGTYVVDNYALENETLKLMHEAHIAISLRKQKNLWLDAGIFPSHIGFESAISIDKWTLSRSLVAENSPYYLSGAKLSYKLNNATTLMLIACNGWQRIDRVEGNSLPAFGTQVNYVFPKGDLFNWSTFLGSEDPDSTRRLRLFNNFYCQLFSGRRINIQAGFDIGLQEQVHNGSEFEIWYGAVMIMRAELSKAWMLAARGEYYEDKSNVVTNVGDEDNLQLTGLSMNLDYRPEAEIALRVEARWLHNRTAIFYKKNGPGHDNITLTASIVLRLKASNRESSQGY